MILSDHPRLRKYVSFACLMQVKYAPKILEKIWVGRSKIRFIHIRLFQKNIPSSSQKIIFKEKEYKKCLYSVCIHATKLHNHKFLRRISKMFSYLFAEQRLVYVFGKQGTKCENARVSRAHSHSWNCPQAEETDPLKITKNVNISRYFEVLGTYLPTLKDNHFQQQNNLGLSTKQYPWLKFHHDDIHS